MKITKKAVLAIMCLSLAAFAPGKAHAANKVQIPDGACRKGNDIYYSYSGSGLRMDLMKINTKTHKKKMIVSNKYKGRTTNGFFDLNIKGNNIYATYNIVDGSDGFNCYICKINRKKEKQKNCLPKDIIRSSSATRSILSKPNTIKLFTRTKIKESMS